MQWRKNGTFAAVLNVTDDESIRYCYLEETSSVLTTKADRGVIIASGVQSSGVVLWYFPL